MRLYGTFVFLLFSISSFSQVVTVQKVELAGDKVIVHYDLEDNNPNNEYQLNLFASRDNFSTPLTKVTGDVGPEVKPGTGRRMEWDIVQEYGNYKGLLSLEIRGKVYLPFVKLQGFDTKKGYKRGKSYNINWKSGAANPVNIELYKGGERIGGDVNHPNNGNYTLFIPKTASKGSNYRLKISDARNTDDVIYSGFFKVVPKVPLLLKAAPVVVAGGVAALMAGGGGDPEKKGDQLPAAPEPGGN